MKTTTKLRSFLLIAGSSLLAISFTHAQNTYTWANSNVTGTPAASLNWFNATQGTWTGGTPVSSNLNTIQFFQDTTTALLNTATPSTQASVIDNGGSAFQLRALTLSGLGSATTNANLTMNISGDALNFSAATGTINLNALNATRSITYNVSNNIQLGTASSAGALTLTGNGTSAFNFGGIISELQAGGGSVIKSGSSTASLTGANTYTGTTNIRGGTLNLGGGTSTGSLTSTVLNLGGGTFSYTRTGTNAQNFTTTNITGANTVTTSLATQTVGLGSIVRTVGGTVNFGTTGTNTTSNTNTNGILGGWATTNGDNWATKSGSNIAAFNAYTATNNVAATYLNANMDVGTATLTGAGTINTNSLRFSGGSVKTLTLDAGDNIIQSGGILVRSDVGNNLQTITGGNLLGSASGDLIIHQNNTSNGLTIASLIKNNGGATALTKSGGGLLTLSGNNTFTGGIIVNAGTLSLSGTPSFAGGVTLNGGTLSTSSAGLNDNLITVNGIANFDLASGATTNSGITLNAGSALSLRVNNSSYTVNGAVTGAGTLVVSGAGSGNSAYTLSSAANTFTGGVDYSFSTNGATTLNVNSFADSATPGAGNIRFGVVGGAGQHVFNLASGALTLTNRQFEFASANTPGTISNSSSQAFTINSNLLANVTGTRTLTLGGNGSGLGTFAGTITNGNLTTLGLTKAGTGTWTISDANTYNGKTTINAGTLSINSILNDESTTANALGTPGVGANSIIDMANTGRLRYTGTGHSSDRVINNTTAAASTFTLDASGASGAFALTGGVTSAGTSLISTLTLTGTGLGSQSGAITNGTGTNVTAIAKTGTGTWTLGGTNLNTGTTNLSGGGTLVLDYTTNDTNKIAGVLTLAGGTLTMKGGVTRVHLEDVTSTSLNAGGTFLTRDGLNTAKLNMNAITRAAGGTISFGSATLANTDTNNINNILGGYATLGNDWAVSVNSGAADTSVTALASYTGSLPSGTAGLATSNFTLIGPQNQTIGVLANTVKITGTGTGDTLALGTNNLTITYASATSLGGILYTGGGDDNYNITGTGKILTSTTTGELIINTTTGTLTVSAPIVATGATAGILTKTGAGTLAINVANSYTGATFVNQGVLRLMNATASGSVAGGITVQNGAALELTGGITIGAEALTITGDGISSGGALRNVSGANVYQGAIIIGTSGARINNAATGINTLEVRGITTAAFSNVTFGGAGNITHTTTAISGAGGLIKDGAGTLTTNVTNTYTGATTVTGTGSKLIVNGSISTSVLTTVQTGATLGGGGSVGALTIDSGGFFAPGNSPGITTVNGNYIQNGSLVSEITGLTAGTLHDQVVVNGTVTLNGLLSLTMNTFTPVADNLVFLLLNDSNDAITGNFTGLANGDVAATYAGFNWQISYFGNSATSAFTGGNDIVLKAVTIPEPGAALLGSLGLLALLRRRR